jgi:hypothetical protein
MVDETEPQDDELIDVIVTDDVGNVISTPAESDPVELDDPAPEFATLKRNFDQLSADHARLTNQVAELSTAASATAAQQWESDRVILTQGAANAKAAMDAAEIAYANAMAENDPAAAAKAQRTMVELAAEEREFKIALQEHGTEPPAVETAPKPAAKPQVQAGDYEANVARMMDSFTPTTRAYAERNKSAIFKADDPKPLQKIIKLHEMATDVEGIKPDTPEYFAYLDKHMGFGAEPAAPRPNPTPRPVNQRKPSMPSAPGSRGGGAPPARRQVPLTQTQIDIANRMGMSPAKYAANVDKINQGSKDPNYDGPRWARDKGQQR